MNYTDVGFLNMSIKTTLMTATIIIALSPTAFAQNALRPDIVKVVQAEKAIETHGALRKSQRALTNVSSGDWFSINTGNLGVGIDTITMRYAKGDNSIANLEVRSGSLTGPLIASGGIPNSRSWTRYRHTTYTVDSLKGAHELFFIFSGGGNVGNIDNIRFSRAQKNILYSWRSNETHGVQKLRRTVQDIDEGDWVKFRNIRMGNGFSKFSFRYSKNDENPNKLSLHLDHIDGPKISEIDIPNTKGRKRTITGQLNNALGSHDIFAQFSGAGEVSSFDNVTLKTQPLSTKLRLANASRVEGMSFSDNQKYLNFKTARFSWFRFDQTSVSYNPKIEFSYARASNSLMKLEVRRSGPNGRIIQSLNLPSTGGDNNFKKITTRLKNTPQGIYNLTFRLVGSGGVKIGDIDLIRIDENETPKQPLGDVNLDNIVIDQFGYRPKMDKVAILRDSEVGLDSDLTDYIPGNEIALVDAQTNDIVFTASSQSTLNGAVDPTSGDKVWTFDFSTVQTPGSYYVYDADNNARSANFDINENVYENVLREAFRTFVYQRSGFNKTAEVVGEDYVDIASHTGPRQDSAARLFDDQRNRTTERNLSGGWYDAGDFKKYSNWTADYVLGLLHAYHDNPDAWSDDWNLPESGNGIPDILDEVRWGVEQLQKMQETSAETSAENVGAVLSVLDSDDRFSPASANGENSFYGPASTSATFNAAGAYAFAASTFENIPDQGFQDLAESLGQSAISAYQWAVSNPNIRFNNPENGVGNGNSEVTEDYFLEAKQRIAAIYLYGLTQAQSYKNFIETDYTNSRLITTLWASPFEVEEPTALLHYSTLEGISPAVGTDITNRFNEIMEQAGNARPVLTDDPYGAFMFEHTWGSNKHKSRKGHMFAQLVTYDLGERPEQENLNAAAGYLHYIHGVNPLGKVYLTNMQAFGAERSVDEFYHRWFADGSPWDNVNSSIGPPPGYLVGGANQYYNEDDGSLDVDQPPTKSYVETNAYLDNEQSWQFTENSNGYQIEYLKLLSQFVK